MKRVLIVAYGGAHLAVAVPLRRALIATGFEPVILALTTTVQYYRTQNIAFVRFVDHVDITDARISHWGKLLGRTHHREGIGIHIDESTAYLGASMVDLIDAVGQSEALAKYERLGLNAFLPIRTLRRILRTERINAVIATDSPRAERAALLAALSLELPSLCVAGSFVKIGIEFLCQPDQGQIICVLNQRMADQLIHAGRSAESIRVTGNPAFDDLQQPQEETARYHLRNKLGIDDSRWVVLWAEQPEPDNIALPVSVRNQLALLCEKHGWQLVIRLHPSSQAHGANEPLPATAILSPRLEPIRDALLQADVVVTLTSTVGLEALVMNKNLLIASISQYSHCVDFREEDGAYVISRQEDIESALLDMFQGSARTSYLQQRRLLAPKTGQSASAVVHQLIEIMEESQQ